MKNTFWDKRIPTLLSLILIVISIVITSFLVRRETSIVSRADITQTPQNVKITNISDKSFTISYITEVANIGSVNFGVDANLGQAGLDDKDQETGLIRPRRIHSFTLKNLKPKTTYFFAIVSGKNTFLENDVPYKATTAPTPQITLQDQPVIQGKVILPTSIAPEEALIYVNTEKAQEISALSQSNGQYLLPLTSLLLKDLSYPVVLGEDDVIKITITDGKQNSSILLLAKQVKDIPVVTLSNDYDFILGKETIATESAALSTFSSQVTNIQSSPSPTPTATPTPTLIPTPTIAPTLAPTTKPLIPSPITLWEAPLGNQTVLLAGVAGIAISVFGILLFIATRGGISH